jgi:site-specific DNA-methyltransferase (adenine-specific)
MSIAVACHDYGFDLTLSEKDTDHFNDGFKRVQNHLAQISMF